MRAVIPFFVGCLTLSACATTEAVHRGAERADIHKELARILQGEGYTCTDSPDRSFISCTHAEVIDLTVAYLGSSNLVQVSTAFTKNDDGLADAWRGPCPGVLEPLNKLHQGTVVQGACHDNFVTFAMTFWVPEHGFTDEDVVDALRMFRQVVSESIQGAGMLKSEEASPAAPAPPSPGSTT